MICVITDEKTGNDTYRQLEDKTSVTPTKDMTVKCYATLSDALRDSEIWQNGHYSDGECLDYVMRAIEQLEGTSK